MKTPKFRFSWRRQVSQNLVAIESLQRNLTQLVQENDGLKKQVTHYSDAFQNAVMANFALASRLRDETALLATGLTKIELPKAVMAWARKTYSNRKK